MGKTITWQEIHKLKADIADAINTLNEVGLLSDEEAEKMITDAIKVKAFRKVPNLLVAGEKLPKCDHRTGGPFGKCALRNKSILCSELRDHNQCPKEQQ